ncbi:peptide methionine sulfoxide reductase [Sulfurifustis variabilis]|uniref:Peptide methionine sulfoxide reductase MsrA n=2 Tax=Sulfurifustis variabilis TaxID=1675686 RepID=A0A1B4V898_9GAMM|nr:peptide-methionine (S)-S-oxide reductase MsrA [Sulfurifustis variabilis]BAU47614.1 peptide methionine sulfoxide reductase [Sulfurifustis variabilis]
MRASTLGIALLVLMTGAAFAGPGDEAPLAKATFAGGCFWCMEPPFDALDGVVSTTSGYTGGAKPDPTYKEVSLGGTGHVEAVQILYDPRKISYERLLEVYWMNVDPFDPGGQFCDRGEQYATAIFYHDESQRRAAERSKEAIAARFPHPIVTPLRPAAAFYAAEEYHQDYYVKNPVRYKFYRYTCGRDRQLEKVWGRSEPQ